MPDDQVDETTEDETSTDEETTEDQESTEDEAAEWTPPTKAEYEKLQKDTKLARTKRDQYRRDLAALRKAVKATDGEEGASGNGDTSTSDKWLPVAVRQAARASLKEAGFNGDATAAKKLIAIIDLSAVEPDDDGEIDISEQIDDLKSTFPALFARPGPAGAPRVTTGRGREDSAPEKDVTKEHSLKLLQMGRSRR